MKRLTLSALLGSSLIRTGHFAVRRTFLAVVMLAAGGARAAEPTFVDVTAQVTPDLTEVGWASVSWADFNNDGKLDFLLNGFYWKTIHNPDGSGSTYPVYPPPLWLNIGNQFSNVTDTVAPEPPRLSHGSVAWTDYDNDGLLDYISTGGFASQIWRNTGSGFSNVTATVAPGLVGVDGGSVAWGDYDNDGRPDFLIAGGIPRRSDLDDDYPYLTPVAQLWRNTGSGFENVTATATPGLSGVFWGSVTWADFDNDGRLDFLITGRQRYGGISQFWRNTGHGFENVTASVAPDFPAITEGTVDWGDYDNDGWLDILVTGGVSPIWRNTGSSFTNVTALVAPTLPRVYHGSAAWGDYDDDGRLDILIAGANRYYCDGCDPPSMVTRLQRNTTPQTNAPASVITRVPGGASQTSVMLNGSIHPHRQVASGWFIWGDSTNYGHLTAAQSLGSGKLLTNFSQTISGLTTGVTYYYRAVGSNAQGKVVLGVEQRFVLALPVLTTSPAGVPATMNAHVDPNNLPTYGWFEWGITPSLGQVTGVQFLANGFDATLSQNLRAAEPGDNYYYRAVASNSLGVVYGAAQNLVATQPIVACPVANFAPPNRSHGHGGGAGYSVYLWIECDWTAINTNSWITLSATNGSAGENWIGYSVALNYDPQPRSGNIIIGGHNFLVTQAGGRPVISAQPTNQSVLGGDTVSFNVAVLGTNSINYQWQFNGSPLVDGNGISGATTSTLVLTGVQPIQAGSYRVLLTYPGRITYSLWVNLTVACGSALSASSATFDSLRANGSVTLNALSSSCQWSIVNTNPWLAILSNIKNSGNGTVVYALAANSTPMARTGIISIADQTLTIIQAGGTSTNSPPSLAEALDTEGPLSWKPIGTPAWFGQSLVSHDGVDAAQAGPISDDTAVTAQAILVGPGTLSFWWKVSSETNKDFLKFSINGVQQTRISGEVDWQYISYTYLSGVYTSKWTYSKNYQIASGQDRGWLDQVAFERALPPSILKDGSFGFISNRFGFNVSGETGHRVVVEATTNFVNWTPLSTNATGAGLWFFSDPSPLPTRFYRLLLGP